MRRTSSGRIRERSTSSLAWSTIKEVWQLPEAWLLFVGKGMYFTPPLRDIDADAQEFIRAHASAAGAKIR